MLRHASVVALCAAVGAARHLLAGVDCGSAFQPCCLTGPACFLDDLVCVSHVDATMCEPCGAPFAQPCPAAPYCSDARLIPTERRVDNDVQCRPCGTEWQPCCGDVDHLCRDGFTCFPEQDRCVVPAYVHEKEAFSPVDAGNDGVAVPVVTARLCGGAADPPCVESRNGTLFWSCGEGFVIQVPDFLCALAVPTAAPAPAPEPTAMAPASAIPSDCGAENEQPCGNVCNPGLSVMIEMGSSGTCSWRLPHPPFRHRLRGGSRHAIARRADAVCSNFTWTT